MEETRRVMHRGVVLRTGGGGRAVLVVLWVLAAVGCAGSRQVLLDVPPGHRAVLGRVELSGFGVSQFGVQIEKEDRTFGHELVVGLGDDFAIAVPPGRYRMVRLRAVQALTRGIPDDTPWFLNLTFEAGPEPTVYIGTVRLSAVFGAGPRVVVVDEFDRTVPAMRARYRDLGEPVVRRLVTPA